MAWFDGYAVASLHGGGSSRSARSSLDFPGLVSGMDAAAWFLQNAATVNRVRPTATTAGDGPTANPFFIQMETLSDSLLDAAVKRSVEMQEQYLDRACLPSAS